MKFSRIERLLLCNQYKILHQLEPDKAKQAIYRKGIQILQNGFELEYSDIYEQVLDEKSCMSNEECLEIVDIANLFCDLKASFDKLKDRADLEQGSILFKGFHENEESLQLNYLKFLLSQQKFQSMQVESLVSQATMLPQYRKMLSKFEKVELVSRTSMNIATIKEIAAD